MAQAQQAGRGEPRQCGMGHRCDLGRTAPGGRRPGWLPPAYRRRGYARAALEAHCRAPPGRPHRVRALPTGAVGEILTRGYHVMKGCLGNPSATAEAVDTAGWPHAGDLDSMDERGYCRIEGRLKEMIIRGGDSIYPREVEQLLHAHPAVADVAVVGVPVRRLLGRAGGSVCQACPAVHA